MAIIINAASEMRCIASSETVGLKQKRRCKPLCVCVHELVRDTDGWALASVRVFLLCVTEDACRVSV